MGPKLFQIRRNPTTYTIRWLPLGGYVRLAGSDDESKLDPGMTVILQLNDQTKLLELMLLNLTCPLKEFLYK